MLMINTLINRLIIISKQRLNGFYYLTRESFLGHHKRDIVVIQVNQTCRSLKSTQDQFQDALQQFKNIVSAEPTTLDDCYLLLKRQLEFCQARADDISHRITVIETVSASLLTEWSSELEQYSSRTLRNKSWQQLKVSKQQYNRLLKTMRKAESRIYPVLAAFKDQVLFLKHNLNAQAIANLQHEFVEIGVNIVQLIEVMETTIDEANQFVSLLADQRALPSP